MVPSLGWLEPRLSWEYPREHLCMDSQWLSPLLGWQSFSEKEYPTMECSNGEHSKRTRRRLCFLMIWPWKSYNVVAIILCWLMQYKSGQAQGGRGTNPTSQWEMWQRIYSHLRKKNCHIQWCESFGSLAHDFCMQKRLFRGMFLI